MTEVARFSAAAAFITGWNGQYVLDRWIPLTRTLPDGTLEDVLGWLVNGVLHVHPDREASIEAVAADRPKTP